ncbi:MAG: T9SS type A sorting domain-containing protein [Bacteroidetes bacterium]|nr:T9SS type A sorting domain-containing protein [Bacteroidota bacterium]MCW5895735.1 T9SS type A sorting domain-containing protein [Bacteroidota bacterium]
MKRIVTLCLAVLVISILVAMLADVAAQTIKVNTIGRSLNSLTAPVPGATAPAWNISTGLRAVGVQSRVYFQVDSAGSGAGASPVWTILAKPATSTATLDSATGSLINSIKVDVGGEYVVRATIGALSAQDTVFATTYWGVSTDPQGGCFCHPNAATIKTNWQASKHATLFNKGITGNSDVSRGQGQYSPSCIKCHTNGWDPNANNNNFGYQVKQTGWDTSWYAGLPRYGNYYLINQNDTSRWNMLTATQKTHANVGCESCHGPMVDHKLTADPKKAGLSIKADVCNVCHDGSRRHSIGTYFEQSGHSQLHYGGAAEGGRANCQPCHTGAGFLYYTRNAPASYDTIGIAAKWVLSRDAGTSISCQACHDPHGNNNPYQLRSVRLDSLRNGYRIPESFNNNPGMLCAHCHSSRYSINVRIKANQPPYYGFNARFYAHYNTQADMLYGSNGSQVESDFLGLNTHGGLEGGCTSCHMQKRKNRLDGSNNLLSNHSFSMTDTIFAGNVYKPTDACKSCHGHIEDFNDIRAFYDFDRNGVIEGVQTEVQGLLTQLKAILPQRNGEVIGGGTVNAADSAMIHNRLDLIRGIWAYKFVLYDGSLGIHNTKYAVRLLYQALGWTPLTNSVKELPGIAQEFSLGQNYPNPFNPTTNIRFSLPKDEHVTLQVYDVTGALVKTIVDQTLRSGNAEATWDGTNDNGSKVASGMYLYRLKAGNFVTTKKMIMMK